MAGETNSDLDVKDVSSLMRIEKASGQLSEVRKDLYPAMLALQERVARECEKADMESMDYDLLIDKKRKLLTNIKLVVEFRMNKVAAMALRGAMGTQNATENLPPEERLFYEECLEAAKKLWNAPHKRKKNVHVPEIVPEPEVQPEPVTESAAEPVTEPAAEMPIIDEGPTEMEAPPEEFAEPPILEPVEEIPADIPPIPEKELQPDAVAAEPVAAAEDTEEDADENPYADCFDMVTIRVTENVEPFAGADRNYSLKKEDVVRLPKSLASILVGRKLAVVLNI